jgi:hypothetical protein
MDGPRTTKRRTERHRPRPERQNRRGLGRGPGAGLPPGARLAEAATLRRKAEACLPAAPSTRTGAVAPRLPPAPVPEGGPSRKSRATTNRAVPSRAQRPAVRLQASAQAMGATLDASFGRNGPKAFSLGGGLPRAPPDAGTPPHGRARALAATAGSPSRPVVRGGRGHLGLARVRLRTVGEPKAVAASVRVRETPPGARAGRRELRALVARRPAVGDRGRASALPRGRPAEAAFAGSPPPEAKALRQGPAVRLASGGHGHPAAAARRAASMTRAGNGPPEEPGGANPRRPEVRDRAPDGLSLRAATAVVPRADAVRQDPAGGRRGAPSAKHESPRRPAAVVQPPRTPWTTDS